MTTIKLTHTRQPREALTISQQRARIEGADMARIPHLLNPYPPGTEEYTQWQHGNDEANGVFKPANQPTTNPARRAGVMELYEKLQDGRHICLAGAQLTVWNLADEVQYQGSIDACDPSILAELLARSLVKPVK